MPSPGLPESAIRFGEFAADLESGELHRDGTRVKLQGQPFEILALLLKRPGRIVSREELRQSLWPSDTFVDFEHGLNAAVNRLREALGDSPDNPRFIETLPRRGYRFTGQTEQAATPSAESLITVVPGRGNIAAARFRNWNRLFLGVGSLLVMGVGAYIFLRQPRNALQRLTVIPFTSYPGFEASPTFAPNGDQIAFSWYREQESSPVIAADLYVKQIGNERAVRLTKHQAQFLVPAWSPDGRNIAFGMVGKDGNGIYLLPALGGRERRLAELRPNNWQWLLLSWSPDSRWLAFASDSPTPKMPETGAAHYRIHMVNVETGEERVLPEPGPHCMMTIEPAFSPNGRYIASACVLTWGVSKLYVQVNDGMEPREVALVEGQYVLAGLAWAADGESIIYSTYGTNGGLWRVSAAGGRPVQVLSFTHGTQTPAITRGGDKLAYAQTNYHFDIWSIGLGARPGGAKATKLISSSWDQANPQISPDGKLIAFDSDRSGKYEIWICNRDGSDPLQLSFFGGPPTGNPRWSPDGRQIVFNSKVSGHSELYILPVDGGRPKRLATGTPSAVSPFWSADGRWVYFATEEPNGIWKVSAEGGAAVRLTRDGANPRESADGKRLFYVVRREGNALWSVSVNGGDERHEDGIPPLRYELSWAPIQGGICFVDGPPASLSLNYFNFSDRRSEKVSELRGITFLCCDIAVSRDKKALLFSGLDRLESDIMLVENFR